MIVVMYFYEIYTLISIALIDIYLLLKKTTVVYIKELCDI